MVFNPFLILKQAIAVCLGGKLVDDTDENCWV